MPMTIHFLNVGHGDCTIIEHGSGHMTVVDINNGDDIDASSASEIARYTASSQDEMLLPFSKAFGLKRAAILERAGYDIRLTNPVDFLRYQYPERKIFRYIQSHPDLDHMRGLVALRSANIGMINFWDTEHEKEVEHFHESDKAEWEEYEAIRNGDRGVSVLRLYRDAHGPYYNRNVDGSDGGDGIFVLAPTRELVQSAQQARKPNNLSYVLWLEYKGIKVVLAGDAESEVWESILAKYGAHLKCHVLKASHHGRDSGYHQEAIAAMAPEYTIVSVGKKPETDASNKYRQYSGNVWSTRWRGNIRLKIDDNGKANITSEYER